MKKEIIIITAMLALILLLAISDIKAQTTGYIYLTSDSAHIINTGKIIVSGDYVNILLEPIPGKVTRWEITRKEEAPVIEPVVTIVNNTELTYTGLWEHPAGATYTVSHSNQVGATAKYSFTGNRVEVISDLDPSHGKIGYTINSGTEKFVDLYKATRLNGQVVINEIVPPGFNTITFRVVDKTVLIDYLKITR